MCIAVIWVELVVPGLQTCQRVKREGEMVFEWTDSLSVGNAMMDADHQNLIGMIRAVEHALRSGDCVVLSQSFQLLLYGVGIHFANEERLALALELPFDQHKKLNRAQQYELEHMRTELEAKSGIWSGGAVEHFSCSLRNWLSEHIGRDGERLRPVLAAHPYHFKP
ncbi:MAG TPA: hypothetical protein VFW59_03965 [Gallionella sp.]|nr:hypothetical protein [Gallionella sp.]